MRNLKYAVKHIKKNRILNLALTVQATFLFAVIFFGVYVICSKYKFYSSFSSEIKGMGMQVEFDNVVEDGVAIRNSDDVKEILQGVDSVASTYRLWVSCEKYEVNAYAYDEALVSSFTPELQAGDWLCFGIRSRPARGC